MIEAKYLCIGDLVMYNNKVHIIEEIDGKTNTVYVESDDNDSPKELIICDDLEPVPITEEILEKNEWEHDGTAWWLLGLSLGNLLYYNTITKDIYLEDDDAAIRLTNYVYHVHQLQQILRVLGERDLAEMII